MTLPGRYLNQEDMAAQDTARNRQVS